MEGWGEAVGDSGQYSQDFRLQAPWLIRKAEETFFFAQTHFLHRELGGKFKKPEMPALWAGRVSPKDADSEIAAVCPGSWQLLGQSKINLNMPFWVALPTLPLGHFLSLSASSKDLFAA